jgi:hypothetical protein
MEEPPWAYRRPEDEPLFKRETNDPAIEPDSVSPAVEGYFRIPAVWIGDAPDPDTVRVLNPPVHHAVVLRKKLRCGIEVRVQRDGTFLFDFSSWPLAPTVVIPGYRKPDQSQNSYRVPLEHTDAEQKAEAHAVFRAQVMNAHQACLTTSESVVKHRSAAMGFPVNAWSTHKAITFNTPPSYHDDIEDTHALARNVLNNKDQVSRQCPLSRCVLELEVVEHSLDMLDAILANGDAALVQLIEAAYMAACRQREKRFGEAVVLGWGVCEQLISLTWEKLLEDAKSSTGTNRMPKDRREKLTGRDYTASVMVEMLEINGRIDRELYRLLEVARKARNDWAHKMRAPKQNESYLCIRAIETLLRQVKGVQLSLQPGGRGGVPRWRVWIWERVKAQGGP